MKLDTFTAFASVVCSTVLAVGEPSGSVAATGRSEQPSTSTTVLTEERAARGAATPNLGDWVGVYPVYCDDPDLKVAIQDASGTTLITGGGQSTCYSLHGMAKAQGAHKVDIYYDSAALGCGWPPNSGGNFSKGDLLLSIERKSGGYVPHWEALESPCNQTVYRENQGIAQNGRKLEGPYPGEGLFNHMSPGGVCGYNIRYRVFYNIALQVAGHVNSALRAAAGVPSAEEMKECDAAQRREPPSEKGPRYCKKADSMAWLIGDRIGSAEISLSELWPCADTPAQEGNFSQRGLTFDLKTGRFFKYSDLFRPESRGQVDKLIFSFLAGKMKQVGIDYRWEQFLKDKKETYEFILWSKTYDRCLVTLKILDFPYGGFAPELPLDQLKNYANPDGPLAPASCLSHK